MTSSEVNAIVDDRHHLGRLERHDRVRGYCDHRHINYSSVGEIPDEAYVASHQWSVDQRPQLYVFYSRRMPWRALLLAPSCGPAAPSIFLECYAAGTG